MPVFSDIVDQLPITRPFSLDRFVRSLSERQGRSIELVPNWLGASAPCGMLVCTKEVDYVCYASNTSWLHQLHIILHEIGHLVLGHDSRRITVPLAGPERSAPEPPAGPPEGSRESLQALQGLLPRLSPALIRRLLGRTAYVEDDERDAEVFATLAGDRISNVVATSDRIVTPDLGLPGPQSLFDIPSRRGHLDA